MREIKFRGLDFSGMWLFGGVMFVGEGSCIAVKKGKETITVDVKPETVGQYTGMKDKNGKEIYEGDILEIEQKGLPGGVSYVAVIYNEKVAAFCGCYLPYYTGGGEEDYTLSYEMEYMQWIKSKIVGNVYEDTEMMKAAARASLDRIRKIARAKNIK